MPKKPPCDNNVEIENPKTHFCVKLAGKIGKELAKLAANTKCPEGKIINPKTGRCVKTDGDIGKALVAEQQCPPGTIVNPKTGKCVKIDGKIGKLLFAPAVPVKKTAAVPVKKTVAIPVKKTVAEEATHRIMLKKATKTTTISIRFKLGSPKSLFVNDKQNDYATIQALLKAYNKVVEKLVNEGWAITKIYGNPQAALEKAIKDMNTCKREQNKPAKPGVTQNTFSTKEDCQNEDTLIMFDDILTIPKEKRIKTADGYCFDIEELAESILSSKALNNPLTRQLLSDQDIKDIMSHNGLNAGKREQLKALHKQMIENSSSLERAYKQHPELVTKFIQALNIAAVTCMSDYTKYFEASQKALSMLGDVISRFPQPYLLVAATIKDKSGAMDLNGILQMAHATCIHGIGYRLADIFMHNYSMLKQNGVKWLPELIGIFTLANNMYGTLYNHTNKKTSRDVSINLYHAESGKMSRIGSAYLDNNNKFENYISYNAWNLGYGLYAPQLYNDTKVYLEQAIADKTAIIINAAELNQMGKKLAI